MKKAALLVVFVLSFIASARTANKVDNPLPKCDPCPFVR
jgi:hypothetical protein